MRTVRLLAPAVGDIALGQAAEGYLVTLTAKPPPPRRPGEAGSFGG